MSVRFQNKRDTAANWTSNDPVLLEGEFGYETDTGKLKIGDGTTAWTSLSYFTGAASGINSNPGSGEYTITGLRLGADKSIIITYDSEAEP